MSPLVLAVGVAAGFGAVLRYATDRALARLTGGTLLPWGTFAVNAAGSLLLGVVTGLLLRGTLDAAAAAVLGAGLCGGLTTFSTWTYETVRLVQDGALGAAALNIGASLAVGLALAAAGLAATGAFG